MLVVQHSCPEIVNDIILLLILRAGPLVDLLPLGVDLEVSCDEGRLYGRPSLTVLQVNAQFPAQSVLV